MWSLLLCLALATGQDHLGTVPVEAPDAPTAGPTTTVEVGEAPPCATSVADVAGTIPSMVTTANGRGELTITHRGFEQRQIALTIDGIPLAMPYDGMTDLGKLPLVGVDHLSLTSSAGTSTGPRGLGGVLDIATLALDDETTASLTTDTTIPYGVTASGTVSLALSDSITTALTVGYLAKEGFPLAASFAPARNEDGGLRDNADAESLSIMSKTSLALPGGHYLTVAGALVVGAHGIPADIYDPSPQAWRWSDWRAMWAYARHTMAPLESLTLEETLFVVHQGNTLEEYYGLDLTEISGTSTYQDTRFGGRLLTAFSKGVHRVELSTSLWWDFHHAFGDSDMTTDDLDEGALEIGVAYRVLALPTLTVTPACALSGRFSDEDSSLAPVPSLTFAFAPLDELTASLAVAYSTRFPTLKERFGGSEATRLPNPDLELERALSAELGLLWEPLPTVALSLSLYGSRISGLIDLVPTETPGLVTLDNTGDASMAGIEAVGRISVAPWLVAKGSATVRLYEAGATLQYQPRFTAFGSVLVGPFSGLSIGTTARVVGPQSFVQPYSGNDASFSTITLLSLSLSYTPWPFLTVRAAADNLLDVAYQTRYGYPAAGRTFHAGLTVTY